MIVCNVCYINIGFEAFFILTGPGKVLDKITTTTTRKTTRFNNNNNRIKFVLNSYSTGWVF